MPVTSEQCDAWRLELVHIRDDLLELAQRLQTDKFTRDDAKRAGDLVDRQRALRDVINYATVAIARDWFAPLPSEEPNR